MFPHGRPQVLVLKGEPKRESGRKAQIGNITAGKAVADIVRTTLGPRSMLKMILDQMGGIQLTNDGHAILREIDVTHPAAKSVIELSRAQDEEAGDGTTSVIVIAGEVLGIAEPYLLKNIHPTRIVKAFFLALDDAVNFMGDQLSTKLDLKDEKKVLDIVKSCIGTKFTHRYSDLMCKIAVDAVKSVTDPSDPTDIDIKKYARIEKIPGGSINDSQVLKGIMINKDILHPKMRRKIVNPRILIMDCNIEYKKGESQTMINITASDQFEAILKQEEEYVKKMCADIAKFKPDIVITEKGVSDLAQYYLVKHGISALRRLRKTDSNRIARAVGAKIVHRSDEIQESDIGTGCGLFEVRLIGDEYFSFFEECKNPKACTIVLRGPSKDILNEIERNLQDAMNVVRNVFIDPRIVPGGGATEMSISQYLTEKSKSIKGIEQLPYQGVAVALEVIPRTLLDNCGAQTIRVITELRAKHANGQNKTYGVDGLKGTIADMNDLGIWEPYVVKSQTLKTAIEAACMLLRIDDIVSGISKGKGGGGAQGPTDAAVEDAENME